MRRRSSEVVLRLQLNMQTHVLKLPEPSIPAFFFFPIYVWIRDYLALECTQNMFHVVAERGTLPHIAITGWGVRLNCISKARFWVKKPSLLMRSFSFSGSELNLLKAYKASINLKWVKTRQRSPQNKFESRYFLCQLSILQAVVPAHMHTFSVFVEVFYICVS